MQRKGLKERVENGLAVARNGMCVQERAAHLLHFEPHDGYVRLDVFVVVMDLRFGIRMQCMARNNDYHWRSL